MKKTIKIITIVFLALIFSYTIYAFIFNSTVYAEPEFPVPNINLSIGESDTPEDVSSSIEILLILTVLALAPSILIMTTCFTRIIIILSFLRKALSTQSTPPNQVLIGFALFLTFFIMGPIFQDINNTAIEPYRNNEITFEQGLENAATPLREFMFRQTRPKDIALFVNIVDDETPKSMEEIPTRALIPAFIISELKTGFAIGFLLFIPFIVIDMVVASTLMSMGMMMLPPVMISLPFKILLFIMVDGWNLITKHILLGFN